MLLSSGHGVEDGGRGRGLGAVPAGVRGGRSRDPHEDGFGLGVVGPGSGPRPAADPRRRRARAAAVRAREAGVRWARGRDAGADILGRGWGLFPGRRLATNDEAIRLLLRAHGDESLDDFARDHQGYTIAARTPIQICGRRAELIRATRAEQHIACVIVKDGNNHPAYIPPTEIVAVGFKHAQLSVVMTLEIRAADPALYKDLREQILRSIRCL